MDAEQITKTTIAVSSQKALVNFSSLHLNERMLEANSFSFSWLAEDIKPTFTDITAFKNANLSQLVTISFLTANGTPNHTFRGFITQINSSITDDVHTSFHITGQGVFCTLMEKVDCKVFASDLKTADIANKLSTASAEIKVNIKEDEDIHDYTVQYNQTAFEFLQMLAIRYGQWMYYDGKVMQFGDKPSGAAVDLDAARDLDNIGIYASTGKANAKVFGYDTTKGEIIKSSTQEAAPAGSDLLKLTDDASGKVYKNDGNGIHVPVSRDQKKLDKKNKLNQEGTNVDNVFITANSSSSTLSVGSVIAIKDEKNKAGQKFIIIDITHMATNNDGYSNSFSAVPWEAPVPNYTNTNYYPRASTQPAIVTDNEDKESGGLDRIRVKFPWMAQGESSPWIPVIIPYAGEKKGYRWLPEVGEDVMIDFLDNNVQRPIMTGSYRTEKGKSGIPYEKNATKCLSSKDGRKIMIEDDKGNLQLKDNYYKTYPVNKLNLNRKDGAVLSYFSSWVDKENGVDIEINGTHGNINLIVVDGGENAHEIILNKDAKSITLKSKGKIILEADEEISLKSKSIKINASQQLSLSGGGVNIEGQQIKVKANTKLEIEATVEAKLKSPKIEIKADAMANFESTAVLVIKGMPVMIN